MLNLSLKKIAEIIGVPYNGTDIMINGITTDSREIQPGNLFITWKGEQLDGHQFCQSAAEHGAAACLVNAKQNLSIPELDVADSIKALGMVAKYWRQQFSVPVIGVTGSNGKTTVKNMLAAIFHVAVGAEHYLAPCKSYNNHVGVPLTLSQLSSKHRYAIIEMGMNHFGELSYLTHIVQPNITVITNAGPSHLEGVGGTMTGVAKAKAEIMEGLQQDGIAVLNADDEFFNYWKEHAQNHRVISFGILHHADVMAKNIQCNLSGSQFDLTTANGNVTINLPLLGEHNILNALAASSVALSVGINLQDIKSGLGMVKPEPHRLELKKLANEAVIIDDCYNANPNSMRKALEILAQFPGNKIAVLADMRELGPNSEVFHKEVGQYAKQLGINHLYATGDLMQLAVKEFGDNAQHFPDREALLTFLQAHLKANNVALFKGSKSMKLFDVVAALT